MRKLSENTRITNLLLRCPSDLCIGACYFVSWQSYLLFCCKQCSKWRNQFSWESCEKILTTRLLIGYVSWESHEIVTHKMFPERVSWDAHEKVQSHETLPEICVLVKVSWDSNSTVVRLGWWDSNWTKSLSSLMRRLVAFVSRLLRKYVFIVKNISIHRSWESHERFFFRTTSQEGRVRESLMRKTFSRRPHATVTKECLSGQSHDSFMSVMRVTSMIQQLPMRESLVRRLMRSLIHSNKNLQTPFPRLFICVFARLGY